MLYLLLEIAALLAAAIVLGIGVGWVLWGRNRVPISRNEFDRLLADRNELYRLKMDRTNRPSLMETMLATERPSADRSAPGAAGNGRSAGLDTVPDLDGAPGLDAVPHEATIELSRVSVPVAPDAPIAEGDDLMNIDGIDLETALFLASEGITDYRRLGGLDDEEIDRLDAIRPSIGSRIREQQWVDQARQLYNSKFDAD